MKRSKGWYRVQSPRNSECGSARLADLDWSLWWTDPSFGQFYLHVAHKDGETIHRVYCRHAECPRLGCRDGELFWVVDRRAAGEGSD